MWFMFGQAPTQRSLCKEYVKFWGQSLGPSRERYSGQVSGNPARSENDCFGSLSPPEGLELRTCAASPSPLPCCRGVYMPSA